VTTSRDSFVERGNAYARDGLFREAVDAYEKSLAQNPNDAIAHRNLGIVLVRSGDYKSAVNHLERVIARFENNFETNFYLAEAYRGQDQYTEAIFRYQNASRVRPSEAKVLKALAWSHFKVRNYGEALAMARKLKAIAPKDEQSSIILARTLLKLRRVDEALELVNDVKRVARAESLPFIQSVEGDVLYEMGRKSEATIAYRAALRDQPLLAGALLGLGRCLLDEGKPVGAITAMERAVRIRPKLPEAHYYLGRLYEKTDPQKAIRYFQYFKKQAAADPEFLQRMAEVDRSLTQLSAPPRR
jgi:tetratricopeptide (TPR) repeat protein